MHVKHTIPYLYIQPSSWRWTFGFETSRTHKKLQIKIVTKKICIFLGLYCIIVLQFTVQKTYKYSVCILCVTIHIYAKDFTIIKYTGIESVVNLLHVSAFFGHFQWLVITQMCNHTVKGVNIKMVKNLKNVVEDKHSSIFCLNYKQTSIAVIHLSFQGYVVEMSK